MDFYVISMIFPVFLLIFAVFLAVYEGKKVKEKRADMLMKKYGLDAESMQHTLDTVQAMRTVNAKPVVNMTAMYLPRIIEDFPDFNFEETRKRAEIVLTSYLRAIDQNDLSLFKYGSDELTDTLRSKIEMHVHDGYEENFDLIKINKTEISKYLKTAGRHTIYIQSSVECVHYMLKDGEVVDGSRDQKYQTRYEMELVYVQDADMVSKDSDRVLEIKCPNCGAPVKNIGHKKCDYCGVSLMDYNIKTFNFISITEK